MPFLTERACEPELMDQESLGAPEHRAALDGLRLINRLNSSVGHLWKQLLRASRKVSGRPLRVLDLACGGGDVTVRLARLACRQQVPLVIHGCDKSPTALSVAQDAALRERVSSFEVFQHDVLQDPLPRDYDVIMCSLFLHHLSTDAAPRVLQAMAKAARRMILVDYLLRSHLGYVLCCLGTRIFTRSKVVHVDGPRSVRAAFSKPELRHLLTRAGLGGAQITYHWPQRFLMSWEVP